jgi:hypothetical protein
MRGTSSSENAVTPALAAASIESTAVTGLFNFSINDRVPPVLYNLTFHA